MAKKYVSRCQILDSGKKISDVKNFKWNERKYREQIKLMDGVGVVDTIPDQAFSLDHVLPVDNPKLDYSGVVDKTYTVLLKGGKRVTFSGVDAMSDGEITVDGEKETVQTVVYSYADFVIE